MNTFSTWLTGLMLLIFAGMVGIALQYPEGARMMPLVIGMPGIALCLLQLVLDAKNAEAGAFGYRFKAAPKAGKPEAVAIAMPGEEEEFGPHTVRGEMTMWFYFVAFIAAVLTFGFYVSVPVMLVSFLRREAGTSWRLALGLGLGATLVMFTIFSVLLHIRLHPGVITPMLMRNLGF
jgi:hypothetical protein